MSDVMVYQRDASWHNRPGTSFGRYHLPSKTDEALAACSRQIVLNEKSVRSVDHVMAGEFCRRCFPSVAAVETPKENTK